MVIYILLIVAAFIVALTFVAGKAVNVRKQAAADHAYRMTQLKFEEDEKLHRRYLEAIEADRTPSDAELATRAAEATEHAKEAELKILRLRRNRY